MERLNELDGDQVQSQLDFYSMPIQKKKKKMLGLNDSREHDFDVWA